MVRQLAVVVAVLAAGASAAWADGSGAMMAEVRLNLARMAANEAALSQVEQALHEERAIWQVTVTVAGSMRPRRLLRAQRALSPRVTGASDRSGRGSIVWTRNLEWSDARPRGYDETMPWRALVPKWRQLREQAAQLVQRRPAGPCEGKPLAWGGPGLDRDHLDRRNTARLRRGLRPLVPLDCGPTVNLVVGVRP